MSVKMERNKPIFPASSIQNVFLRKLGDNYFLDYYVYFFTQGNYYYSSSTFTQLCLVLFLTMCITINDHVVYYLVLTVKQDVGNLCDLFFVYCAN